MGGLNKTRKIKWIARWVGGRTSVIVEEQPNSPKADVICFQLGTFPNLLSQFTGADNLINFKSEPP